MNKFTKNIFLIFYSIFILLACTNINELKKNVDELSLLEINSKDAKESKIKNNLGLNGKMMTIRVSINSSDSDNNANNNALSPMTRALVEDESTLIGSEEEKLISIIDTLYELNNDSYVSAYIYEDNVSNITNALKTRITTPDGRNASSLNDGSVILSVLVDRNTNRILGTPQEKTVSNGEISISVPDDRPYDLLMMTYNNNTVPNFGLTDNQEIPSTGLEIVSEENTELFVVSKSLEADSYLTRQNIFFEHTSVMVRLSFRNDRTGDINRLSAQLISDDFRKKSLIRYISGQQLVYDNTGDLTRPEINFRGTISSGQNVTSDYKKLFLPHNKANSMKLQYYDLYEGNANLLNGASSSSSSLTYNFERGKSYTITLSIRSKWLGNNFGEWDFADPQNKSANPKNIQKAERSCRNCLTYEEIQRLFETPKAFYFDEFGPYYNAWDEGASWHESNVNGIPHTRKLNSGVWVLKKEFWQKNYSTDKTLIENIPILTAFDGDDIRNSGKYSFLPLSGTITKRTKNLIRRNYYEVKDIGKKVAVWGSTSAGGGSSNVYSYLEFDITGKRVRTFPKVKNEAHAYAYDFQ